MKAKMKKACNLIAVVLLISVVIEFVGIVTSPERQTMRYYDSNREILQESILNYEMTGHISNMLDIKANYWNGEHPIIEYTIVTSGFGSASQYYGVFYSFDDVPVAFQNANDMLVPISDTEWEWNGKGDNRGVVRKIESNWFYFEASF